MIRHAAPQTKTLRWSWETDEPTGVSTHIDFEIELGRGDPAIDDRREVYVRTFTVLRVCVLLDLPFSRWNTVVIPADKLSWDDRVVLEHHGRKAYDESGHLSKLIW